MIASWRHDYAMKLLHRTVAGWKKHPTTVRVPPPRTKGNYAFIGNLTWNFHTAAQNFVGVRDLHQTFPHNFAVHSNTKGGFCMYEAVKAGRACFSGSTRQNLTISMTKISAEPSRLGLESSPNMWPFQAMTTERVCDRPTERKINLRASWNRARVFQCGSRAACERAPVPPRQGVRGKTLSLVSVRFLLLFRKNCKLVLRIDVRRIVSITEYWWIRWKRENVKTSTMSRLQQQKNFLLIPTLRTAQRLHFLSTRLRKFSVSRADALLSGVVLAAGPGKDFLLGVSKIPHPAYVMIIWDTTWPWFALRKKLRFAL